MPKDPDDLLNEVEKLPKDNFDDQILDPEWDYNSEEHPIWIDNKKLSDLKGD